jgi:hypothetical protein
MANNFALLRKHTNSACFGATSVDSDCPVVHPSAKLYPVATCPLARAAGSLTAARGKAE